VLIYLIGLTLETDNTIGSVNEWMRMRVMFFSIFHAMSSICQDINLIGDLNYKTGAKTFNAMNSIASLSLSTLSLSLSFSFSLFLILSFVLNLIKSFCLFLHFGSKHKLFNLQILKSMLHWTSYSFKIFAFFKDFVLGRPGQIWSLDFYFANIAKSLLTCNLKTPIFDFDVVVVVVNTMAM